MCLLNNIVIDDNKENQLLSTDGPNETQMTQISKLSNILRNSEILVCLVNELIHLLKTFTFYQTFK